MFRNVRWFGIRLFALVLVASVACSSGAQEKAKGTKKKRAKTKETPPALLPISDDPTLPRVLLIGDSISIGYTLPTREALGGQANIHRIPENGGPTTKGLTSINKWLGDGEWDVIHFNWGLHDLKVMPDGKQQVDLESYEKNLRQLVERLEKTNAKLIWASTTPVPPEKVKPGRSNSDVEAYNKAAETIMKENGIAIDDLYSFALPRLKEIQHPADVHFNKDGSAKLAGQVAKSIEEQLPSESETNLENKSTGFLDKVFKDDSGKHKYVVFIPEGYTTDKKWPVLVFLHGAGERGNDNQKQVAVGLGPAIRKRQKDFPFITIFPQCEDTKSQPIVGWSADGTNGKRMMAILSEVEKTYSTDPDRVYLTGLSMGGFGTWGHAAKFPDRFAAIAPVCGGGKSDVAKAVAHLPIWCFHGDADNAVPVIRSRELIDALKQIGANPKYTEYPGVGHNSWDAAYGTDELYTWLLSHKRGEKAKP